MNRGLLFLIACIVVGGLFLLLASQLRKGLPPAGSGGTADGSGAPTGDGVEPGPSLPPEVAERDKDAVAAIQGADAVEAREWCKPERRSMGFEISKNEMAKMTEELYALGATKVYVVGISKIEDVEVAAAMVAVMPEDKMVRQGLIDWENNLFQYEPEDRVKDVGQKYMYLVLD